jgi:hypothetical protein
VVGSRSSGNPYSSGLLWRLGHRCPLSFWMAIGSGCDDCTCSLTPCQVWGDPHSVHICLQCRNCQGPDNHNPRQCPHRDTGVPSLLGHRSHLQGSVNPELVKWMRSSLPIATLLKCWVYSGRCFMSGLWCPPSSVEPYHQQCQPSTARFVTVFLSALELPRILYKFVTTDC